MNCSGRAASLTLPVRTYCLMIAGTVVVDASRQIGHWRSRYSVTVTGALGSPSTPACSGMPANRAEDEAAEAGGGVAALPPEDETAIAPATSTTAAPATAPR